MKSADDTRRAAFEALYDAHASDVLSYALRRVDEPADAADVVADTFLTAWRRLDDIPPGERSRLWLYGVARNVLSNQRRGMRRRDRLGGRLREQLALAAASVPPPGGGPATVRAAMARLGRADREIIALTAWEGLDVAEAARVLGLRPTTARTRLHRARTRLRAHLIEAGALDGPRLATPVAEEAS
ncbi:MAG: RNA polymerase sigma factor [Thermoleophilia bacterium]